MDLNKLLSALFIPCNYFHFNIVIIIIIIIIIIIGGGTIGAATDVVDHIINNNNMLHLYSVLSRQIAVLRHLRHFTVLLSMTQTCFNPAHTSISKGVYNASCHCMRKALFKHTAITSCQVLIFGWVNQLPHVSIRSVEPATLQLRVLPC